MCNCMTMCWVPEDITDGGRWPMPKHHPNCEDYNAERYIRLFDDDGHSFVDTVENQYVFMSSMDSGRWKQEDVYLTPDQFEGLDEYRGL